MPRGVNPAGYPPVLSGRFGSGTVGPCHRNAEPHDRSILSQQGPGGPPSSAPRGSPSASPPCCRPSPAWCRTARPAAATPSTSASTPGSRPRARTDRTDGLPPRERRRSARHRGAHVSGLARLLGNHHLAGHGAPSSISPPPEGSGGAASMAARNGPANSFSSAAPSPLTSANSASLRGHRLAMSISVRSGNTI